MQPNEKALVKPRELEPAELTAVSGGATQGSDGFPGCGTVAPGMHPPPKVKMAE
jgi:hypothetical protein